MPSLNQCNFIGNVGRDPEIRYAPDGKAIANISIGVTEKWKDNETTEWVRVVAFNKLAEIIGKYVTKGMPVFVSGRMQTRKWQDKSGQDRWTTQIVANSLQMLGGKSGKKSSRDGTAAEPAAREPQGAFDDFDDDIPF